MYIVYYAPCISALLCLRTHFTFRRSRRADVDFIRLSAALHAEVTSSYFTSGLIELGAPTMAAAAAAEGENDDGADVRVCRMTSRRLSIESSTMLSLGIRTGLHHRV